VKRRVSGIFGCSRWSSGFSLESLTVVGTYHPRISLKWLWRDAIAPLGQQERRLKPELQLSCASPLKRKICVNLEKLRRFATNSQLARTKPRIALFCKID
jgi:hypothetical protein